VHFAVPLIGAIGCLFAMFVVNAAFSLLALAVVVAVYGLLMRRRLKAPHEDVRSGLFLMLAEWAARKATRLSHGQARAWKANLLVPVVEAQEVVGNFPLIVDLAKPYGSITLLGVSDSEGGEELADKVSHLADEFTGEGVHTSATTLEAERVSEAILHAMQTLRNAFLRPNLLFLTPLSGSVEPHELEPALRQARRNRMGVILAAIHPKAALGRRKVIRVWVRPQAPDWDIRGSVRHSNLNLQLLIPFLLVRSWRASIEFICAVEDAAQEERAKAYLENLLEMARMPLEARARVIVGHVEGAMTEADRADLNVFGLPDADELAFVRETIERCGSACLFLRDSGEEDALA
jgi:hypothetical protein